MSDLDLRNRFCRVMAEVATDPVVTDRLLDPASETSLDKYSSYGLGSSPALVTAARIRKLPARWAEKVAASVDMAAPEAAEVVELISKDPRLGVRRALVASVKGLPVEVLDRLVVSAMADEDSELVNLAYTNQDPSPGHVVSWLTSENVGRAPLTNDGLRAAAKKVRTDFDATVEAVTRCDVVAYSAEILAGCVSGDVHFVDVLAAAGSDLSPHRIAKAVEFIQPHLPRADLRMIEWLSANATQQLTIQASKHLLARVDDPELIAAWWRSGITGAQVNLFFMTSPATPVVAETIAALPELHGEEKESALAASLMVGAIARNVATVFDHVEIWIPVLDSALSLMERLGFIPAQDQSEEVTDAFSAIAGLLFRLAPHASKPEIAPLFCRLAAMCPHEVGPLLLWQDDPVPGLVDLVAENPELFGVRGIDIVNALEGKPGGSVARGVAAKDPWSTAPERWSLLLWNTPGVISQIARTSSAAHEKVTAPVFEHLSRALGGSPEGWDAVLSLVPSWEGSVGELVGVAATFIDDVVTDAPVVSSTVVEVEADLEVPELDSDIEPEVIATDTVVEVTLEVSEEGPASAEPAGETAPEPAAKQEPALGDQLVLL